MISEEIAEIITEAKNVQSFNVVIMKEEDFFSSVCDHLLNTSALYQGSRINSDWFLRILNKGKIHNTLVKLKFEKQLTRKILKIAFDWHHIRPIKSNDTWFCQVASTWSFSRTSFRSPSYRISHTEFQRIARKYSNCAFLIPT